MLAHKYVGFEPIGKITSKNFDEALCLRLLRRDARHKLTRGPLLQTKFHHTDIQNKLKVFQRVKEHTLLSPSYDKTTPLIRQTLEGHTHADTHPQRYRNFAPTKGLPPVLSFAHKHVWDWHCVLAGYLWRGHRRFDSWDHFKVSHTDLGSVEGAIQLGK